MSAAIATPSITLSRCIHKTHRASVVLQTACCIVLAPTPHRPESPFQPSRDRTSMTTTSQLTPPISPLPLRWDALYHPMYTVLRSSSLPLGISPAAVHALSRSSSSFFGSHDFYGDSLATHAVQNRENPGLFEFSRPLRKRAVRPHTVPVTLGSDLK